jgi:hypothetical protein
MRIDRMLERLLFSKANINKVDLLEDMKVLCPDDDVYSLEQAIEDLRPVYHSNHNEK